ncbi:MAG: XdhC family protein [Rudaea sp.]
MTTVQRGSVLGLLDALQALHARGERGVLGIVFATSGSTYQKAGALVLLDDSGLLHGVISGGCLEPELEQRARDVLRISRADTVDFDMRTDEDVTFGSGTGCHGRVRLLLIPQSGESPLTHALSMAANGGHAIDLALDVEGDEAGSGQASVDGTTSTWGRDGNAAASRASSSSYLQLRIEPPPCVLLLGAGAESVPFRQFARQLGWKSVVVEHRGRWLGFANRAAHDRTIDLAPEAAAAVWRRLRIDAAVLMSHNFSIDLTNLALCADTDVGYVGLLGPVARRDKLLTELGDATAQRLHDRLHAPVGLPLGGSGPDVLALSIASELQQFFTQPSR